MPTRPEVCVRMNVAFQDIKLENCLLINFRWPLLKLCDFDYPVNFIDSVPRLLLAVLATQVPPPPPPGRRVVPQGSWANLLFSFLPKGSPAGTEVTKLSTGIHICEQSPAVTASGLSFRHPSANMLQMHACQFRICCQPYRHSHKHDQCASSQNQG